MSSAISRPIPRAPPVTTATLSLSTIARLPWPDHPPAATPTITRPCPGAGAVPGLAVPSVAGGRVGATEDEHHRRVIAEHHEGHQHAERPVDLVVHAHPPDVEPEDLLGRLPHHAGQDGSREGGPRSQAPSRDVAVAEIEHRRRDAQAEDEGDQLDPLGWHPIRIEHEALEPLVDPADQAGEEQENTQQ